MPRQANIARRANFKQNLFHEIKQISSRELNFDFNLCFERNLEAATRRTIPPSPNGATSLYTREANLRVYFMYRTILLSNCSPSRVIFLIKNSLGAQFARRGVPAGGVRTPALHSRVNFYFVNLRFT